MMELPGRYTMQMRRNDQKTGIFAAIAIIAAIVSFVLTFTGSSVLGLLAAILSVPLGIVGLIMAASPRVSGGMLSILAIVLGMLGSGSPFWG
jgi:hypothetical protein